MTDGRFKKGESGNPAGRPPKPLVEKPYHLGDKSPNNAMRDIIRQALAGERKIDEAQRMCTLLSTWARFYY